MSPTATQGRGPAVATAADFLDTELARDVRDRLAFAEYLGLPGEEYLDFLPTVAYTEVRSRETWFASDLIVGGEVVDVEIGHFYEAATGADGLPVVTEAGSPTAAWASIRLVIETDFVRARDGLRLPSELEDEVTMAVAVSGSDPERVHRYVSDAGQLGYIVAPLTADPVVFAKESHQPTYSVYQDGKYLAVVNEVGRLVYPFAESPTALGPTSLASIRAAVDRATLVEVVNVGGVVVRADDRQALQTMGVDPDDLDG